MKKRLFTFAVLAVALVLGLRVFAAGGTSNDPLISLSYLNGTFLTKLQGMMQEWAREDTDLLYQEVEGKLDEVGEAYLKNDEEAECSYSAYYEQLSLKRGDVITLYTGSGLFWMNGRGYTEAGLVDVTTGTETEDNTEFIVNHRYLAVLESEEGVTVTILSDAAILSVEGYWMLTESDEAVTPFVDLTKSKDWFYDAVYFAVEQGLFNGVSENQFSPLTSMDRSMLAVVLHRMAGLPSADYSGTFPDIEDGKWYTEGVEWARMNGVVTGSSDGTFRPFAHITRQEIALMLYRYAGQYLGLDVGQRGELDGFTDSENISTWARDAVSWAVGVGIITGSDTGAINPQNDASRAEVATMLQRLSNWITLMETAE